MKLVTYLKLRHLIRKVKHTQKAHLQDLVVEALKAAY